MTQFKEKTGYDEEEFEKVLRKLGDRKLKDFLPQEQMNNLLSTDKELALNMVYNIATHTAVDTYKKFINRKQ